MARRLCRLLRPRVPSWLRGFCRRKPHLHATARRPRQGSGRRGSRSYARRTHGAGGTPAQCRAEIAVELTVRPVAARTAAVRFTESFEANLVDRSVLARPRDARSIPEVAGCARRNHIVNIERYPMLGRPFLTRAGQSEEVETRMARL